MYNDRTYLPLRSLSTMLGAMEEVLNNINIEEFVLKTKYGDEVKFSFEIVDVYEGEKYDDTVLTDIVVEFWIRNH